jgi:predicted RNA-binding Zn ribbon-like protein
VLHDPGGREPAPEPLRLVQAFVNTLDIENGVEELDSPRALDETFARIGVGDGVPRQDEAGLKTALAAREALRSLALANNGVEVVPAALRELERVAGAARFTVRFDDEGRARLVSTASGLDRALGTILAVVHEAMTDGSWARLKGCPRDVCHWVFYDRSRNGSGKWCAMSVCGNRTNTRAYRRRSADATRLPA